MLCIRTTLFSGGLCVKPVGRWVIWKQGVKNQETGELMLSEQHSKTRHGRTCYSWQDSICGKEITTLHWAICGLRIAHRTPNSFDFFGIIIYNDGCQTPRRIYTSYFYRTSCHWAQRLFLTELKEYLLLNMYAHFCTKPSLWHPNQILHILKPFMSFSFI